MNVKTRHQTISQPVWQSLFNRSVRPHYTVAGRRYDTKLQAIQETEKIRKATGDSIWSIIKFHCFDELADHDFSIEPAESYQELCILRAHQLRAKYQSIRLWYSGGADSHTTLRSFHLAGLSIDEIVILRNTSIGTDAPSNTETTNLTIPSIARIQGWFPGAKITSLEYVIDVNIKNHIDDKDWQARLSKLVLQSPVTRNMANSFDLDNSLMIAYDKTSHCELVGEPKPSLIKKQGHWYTYIVDNQIDTSLMLPNLELFHFSPDLPQLYVKQCHMLKNQYELLMTDKPDNYSQTLDKDFTQKNIFLQRYNEWDTDNHSHKHHQYAKRFDHNGDFNTTVYAMQRFQNDEYFHDYITNFREVLFQEVYDPLADYFHNGRLFRTPIGMISRFWNLSKPGSASCDELWPLGFGNY